MQNYLSYPFSAGSLSLRKHVIIWFFTFFVFDKNDIQVIVLSDNDCYP